MVRDVTRKIESFDTAKAILSEELSTSSNQIPFLSYFYRNVCSTRCNNLKFISVQECRLIKNYARCK